MNSVNTNYGPDKIKITGTLSTLPIELLLYLLSTFLTCPVDQITLGRSCKWLLHLIQSTNSWQETWRVLSDPTSPLARLARPTIGLPMCMPPAISFKPLEHAICLPLSMISLSKIRPSFPWSLYDHFSIHAGPLLLRPLVQHQKQSYLQPPPRHDQERLFLPLFISQSHFDSSFPLLQDQVRGILIRRGHAGIASMPKAMIIDFFPRLVSNMATKLVLAGVAPTRHDLEVFVQVHLVWRAVVHRFGHQAQAWISSEIQRLVGSLAVDDTFVNLSLLVSLLHVCDTKQWTWPKLARSILDENLIRLFQYVRDCDGCAWEVKRAALPLKTWSIQVGNAMTRLKLDDSGFAHWPVVGFHVHFLRAIRSATAAAGGQLSNQHQLEPGQLACQLHTLLTQRIRAHPSADSWSTLLGRLGSSPIDAETLTSWLSWCDTQAKLRGRSDRILCACELLNPSPTYSETHRAAMAAAMPLTSVTFSRALSANALTPIPDPRLPDPHFAYVALTRRAAFLGIHSTTHDSNAPAGMFPTGCITALPASSSIHLGHLPTCITYVAVLVSDRAAQSKILATLRPTPTLAVNTYLNRSTTEYPGFIVSLLDGPTWRLAHVCVRDRTNAKLWDVVRANGLDKGREFIVARDEERPGLDVCVRVAQEWVGRWEFECRANGVERIGLECGGSCGRDRHV